MDVTLLELHVSDAEFNAPFSGRSPGADESRPDPASAPDDGPTQRLRPLAALLALVGLALVARYLRGGEAEQVTLDELEA
jgi:hypothetical protein